jgi:NADH-quinone oxidoreductase subunit B
MIYRSSPRQTDILLVNGWISKKIRNDIRRLWEEMPAPKWAVAMGECAISGGPWYDAYNCIQGLDQILPVDLYIPGCPARPDAMIDGFMLLQKKIDEYFRRGVILKDKQGL